MTQETKPTEQFDPHITPTQQMEDFTRFADQQEAGLTDAMDVATQRAMQAGVAVPLLMKPRGSRESADKEAPTKTKWGKRVAMGALATGALLSPPGQAVVDHFEGKIDQDLRNENTTTDDDQSRSDSGLPTNPADMVVEVDSSVDAQPQQPDQQ